MCILYENIVANYVISGTLLSVIKNDYLLNEKKSYHLKAFLHNPQFILIHLLHLHGYLTAFPLRSHKIHISHPSHAQKPPVTHHLLGKDPIISLT